MRSPRKKFSIGRLAPGSQMRLARPIMNASRLMETTSLVASLVPTSPRMITRSRSSPKAGASTRRTTASAMGAGQSQSKRSCQ
jgi:hypothetical protein